MKKAFVWGAAAICALCLAGCGFFPTYGSGVIVNRTYDLSGFTEVSAQDAVEVTVDIGPEDTFAVTASCEDNLIDYLQVSVVNGVLTVGGFAKPVSSWYGAKVSVIMPALSEVSASDASKVEIASLAAPGTLSVSASSASEIEFGSLTADAIDMDIGDASRVVVSGAASAANSLNLAVSGASSARLYELQVANDAVLAVSGASNAQVRVEGDLSGSVSSASSIRYKGGAVCMISVSDVSCSCEHVAD